MVSLSDFIQLTLEEINKGIEKSQKSIQGTAIINPREAGGEKERLNNQLHTIQKVDFEVNVLIEESTKKGHSGELNLKVA
jgi:hypothetical protein